VAEIYLVVVGNEIFEELRMPVVPAKGDELELHSLTGGRSPHHGVTVSRIEWVMDQTSRVIYPRLKVIRRVWPEEVTRGA
jgi:hypothetical protein